MWIQVELIVMSVKLPFTYVVLYFLAPKFLLKRKYTLFLVGLLVFGFIAGVILSLQYKYMLNPWFWGETDWPLISIKIIYRVLDLFYVASIPLVFKLFQRQMATEKKAQVLAEEKLSSELQLLKNQLHPHFLFNTLNNLYGMVLTKDERSPQVVLQLSQLLSYMLYECDQPSISLEKELEMLNNYIELEKIRHGDRVNIHFNVLGNPSGKRMAPLLIFPFVENAFKHGVSNNSQTSDVFIEIDVQDAFKLMVKNAVFPSKKSSTMQAHSGIGLENMRRRLALIYPNKHALDIAENGEFTVKLYIEQDQIVLA